jgi:hypothetical protein
METGRVGVNGVELTPPTLVPLPYHWLMPHRTRLLRDAGSDATRPTTYDRNRKGTSARGCGVR